MYNYVTLLKINILRHLVCDVTFSPFPRAPRGWGGLKTVHVHDPVCDVTSGREKRLKPTRIYGYDVTSGL